jgi:hypothetical protein
MTPLERIDREKSYLAQQSLRSGFRISLYIRSTGVAFEIADPSTGEGIYISPSQDTRSIVDFCRALDSAIGAAQFSLALGHPIKLTSRYPPLPGSP